MALPGHSGRLPKKCQIMENQIVTIDELTDLCLEIEGLLLVLKERDETRASHIYSLLDRKVEDLYQKLGMIGPERDADNVDNPEMVVDESAADEEAVAETTEEEQEELAIPVSEDTPVADIVSIPTVDVESVSDAHESCSSSRFAEVSADLNTCQATEDIVLRNEVLTPVELSLNDKFRFRRELFDNSDVDMAETLGVVEQMTSEEELKDYLLNDLCWDAENETVKDFVKFFSARFD